MISPLWWIPLVVTAAGVVPVWLATRRLARELSALLGSAEGLRRVRPVLGQVRGQIIATGRSLDDLAHR